MLDEGHPRKSEPHPAPGCGGGWRRAKGPAKPNWALICLQDAGSVFAMTVGRVSRVIVG